MEQIFVKDFVHETEIGVYQSEFGKKQRLKFNVFLTIDYLNKNRNDNIEDVDSDQVDGGGNKFKGTGDIFIQGEDAGKVKAEVQGTKLRQLLNELHSDEEQ